MPESADNFAARYGHTLNSAGINCGTTCSYAFVQNTSVTLSAAPIAPAAFGGWSGACSGTGTCTVSMNAARSVTANFYYPNQTLTVSKAGSGSGTVTSLPGRVNCGTTCAYAYTYTHRHSDRHTQAHVCLWRLERRLQRERYLHSHHECGQSCDRHLYLPPRERRLHRRRQGGCGSLPSKQ